MWMRSLAAAVLFVPALATAQDASPKSPGPGTDPAIAQLQEVLTVEVSGQIIAIVSRATAQGLPGDAIARRALEAVAKGRTEIQARAAAASLASELDQARAALQAGRAGPSESDIVAGALAIRQGVDGKAISEVARAAPSGRSLTVPIAVIGALVDRGLPADDALAAVLARLEARSDDRDLAELPREVGRLVAQGVRPSEVGLALASQRAGRAVPRGPTTGVPRWGRPGERRPSERPTANR
jgi:hypothetical protein